MSLRPGSRGKQREPPPSLFLHPSPAASHVSLPGILAPGTTGALDGARQKIDGDLGKFTHTALAAGGQPESLRQKRNHHIQGNIRNSDRTDALWAEMQATLEEVELSASGGTHVFGPEHDRKLAELRGSQVALAQAWARSEADDTIETNFKENATATGGDELRRKAMRAAEASKLDTRDASDAGGNSGKADDITGKKASGGVERLGAKLEEETEADIVLARRRREANDQYFTRVNNGVLDVVAKLEEVALAMRAVEQESKDVWDDSRSLADASDK